MSNEGSRRKANSFIIPLESLLELHNEPLQEELSHAWEFRVNNSCHRCVYWREGQTSSLRLHDTSAKESSTSDQVLAKKLRDDVLDVRDVDFID